MLSDRCLSVCPVQSVCNVRALWPNGWTDQDKTWHAGRPWPWPQFVRCGTSSPSPKGAQPPNFRPISVAANGCMDQDATFELDDSKTTGYLDIWHAGSSWHYIGQVLGHRSRFTVRGWTSSSAITERPRDARVTSVRKTAKWNFWGTLLGGLGKT